MNITSHDEQLVYVEKARIPTQLAGGMNGKRGFGGSSPHVAFSFEDAPQLAAGFFTVVR